MYVRAYYQFNFTNILSIRVNAGAATATCVPLINLISPNI